MTDTAKGEFKKAMHVGRLTADKVQLGTAGGYGWQSFPMSLVSGGTLPTALTTVPLPASTALYSRYRIVDTTLFVQFDIEWVSNAAGGVSNANYTFSLPAGCVVKSVTGGSGVSPQQNGVGYFVLRSNSSTVNYFGIINATPSGNVWSAQIGTNGTATVNWGSSSPADTQWTVANGFSMGGTMTIELDPSSPILGEARVQISNGTGSVLTTVAGSNSGSLITGQFQ